jgi:hypothetical protein
MSGTTSVKILSNTQKKQKFIEMRASGAPYSKIAGELSVSKATLSAWNKDLQNEITELKAEIIEELHAEYYMLREARITQLGEVLKRVNVALEGRDFTKLTTDRLVDFKLKLMSALKTEYIDGEKNKTIPKSNEQIIENDSELNENDEQTSVRAKLRGLLHFKETDCIETYNEDPHP